MLGLVPLALQDSEIFYDLTNFLKSSNQVVGLACVSTMVNRDL